MKDSGKLVLQYLTKINFPLSIGDKPILTLQACGTFEADMHDEGEGEQREARIRKAGRVEKVTLLVSMCLLVPKLY